MKNKLLRSISTLTILFMSVLFLSCTKAEEVKIKQNDKFTIIGSGENIEILVDNLKNDFKPVTADVVSISSSGEKNEMTVVGVTLKDLLVSKKIDISSFKSIRAVAGDGYSIEIPEEIFSKRQVILAYKINGELLNDKSKPIRVIVPDERAMYWARNVVKIELLQKKNTITIEKIVFLETAYKKLPQTKYMYYETQDIVVPVKELLSNYCGDCKGELDFESTDGLIRSETNENALISFIKINGKGKPLFLSPDLPGGMYIKNILLFKTNNTCFYSIESGIETMKKDGKKLSWSYLLTSTGLAESEKYTITDLDGTKNIVAAEKLDKGIISFEMGNILSIETAE
ncbi:MAG: molybdopterin-dependent oxidoreductase [Candidatus Delongbacteria bacterium]|jgi:hypothetical protein|nr:molybdopterin-dependent oxidoreductase [Candidatus Delongbacteria bacterium]